VGGLIAVGFVRDSDDVLVLSEEECLLFHAVTGTMLARVPRDFSDDLNTPQHVAPAIDKHKGVLVSLAGLHGGGLSRATDDGWSIEVIQLPWPRHFLFLSSDYLQLPHAVGHMWKLCDDGGCSFRAAGFSPTGLSLVFATSRELVIYGRNGDNQ
jgi:hypothetical protein